MSIGFTFKAKTRKIDALKESVKEIAEESGYGLALNENWLTVSFCTMGETCQWNGSVKAGCVDNGLLPAIAVPPLQAPVFTRRQSGSWMNWGRNVSVSFWLMMRQNIIITVILNA